MIYFLYDGWQWWKLGGLSREYPIKKLFGPIMVKLSFNYERGTF